MNFLFLTTLMILIFSLISSTMSVSSKTTALILINLDKQIEPSLTFINSIASTKYNQSLKSNIYTDANRKEKRKDKKFKKRSHLPKENGKLNLYPLLVKTHSNELYTLTKKTLKNLLNILYKDDTIYKQRVENDPNFLNGFIKEFISGLKKTKSLAKIPFLLAKDRDFFLTLCKGGSTLSGKSISLLDYITLQETNNEPPICFPSLPIEIMEALFGKSLTKKILEEEEVKYFQGKSTSALTKEDLEKYLNNGHFLAHKKALRYRAIHFKKIQMYTKGSGNLFITLGPPVQIEKL